MKKTVIKRRKRVVPALRDGSPTAASSNGSSLSPEMQPASLAASNIDPNSRYLQTEQLASYAAAATSTSQSLYPPPPSQHSAPPPIDFTGYNSKPLPIHHPLPPTSSLLNGNSRNPAPDGLPNGARHVQPPARSNVPRKRSHAEAVATDPAPSTTLPTSDIPASAHLPPINPPNTSSSSNTGRLSSISSLLNHTDRGFVENNTNSGNSHVDPALGSSNARQSQHQQLPPPSFSPAPISASASPTHATTPAPAPAQTQPTTATTAAGVNTSPSVSEPDSLKLERRAQLEREAEKMREALRAKERELAALQN